AAGAEVLDAEGPHDAAEDDGAAERRSVERRFLGQVAEEASGEAITGAGGIDLILQRIRGHGEDIVLVEEHRAVRAAGGDEHPGAHFLDDGSGLAEVVFAGELTGLCIVELEDVRPLEDVAQFFRRRLDPEIHRVHADDAFRRALIEHAELEGRVHVAEEDDVGLSVGVRQDGLEPFEYVEVGEERLAAVQVVAVLAAPAERLAPRVLEALEVDPPAGEDLHVLFVEVLADNGDEVNIGEVRGGDSKVGQGATDYIVGLAERCLNGVESNGTDGDDGHAREYSRGRRKEEDEDG